MNPLAQDVASAPVGEVLAELQVNAQAGLSAGAVELRRRQHGCNEVPVAATHPVLRFLAKFWGVSAWMLELIMVLSALLGKRADLAVVGLLLIVNAAVGFFQEQRAAGVVEALRRRLQVTARVRRDSVWLSLAARELVPGDIVRVRPGDIVPADVKLLEGALDVDQSALTGESGDAAKAGGDMLWSGSVVRRGEADGVVVLTGARTYFGRTTELVQTAQPQLHIEAVVARLVRWLFLIVGTLLGTVAVLSLVRGAAPLEVLPLMLVLLMSAVPVALPVMFTVTMAVGARQLARRGVLVTRLSAVEDAATMDVLCVDKTGTITMNRLAVTGVIAFGAASDDDVLSAAALASREANQDPIDLACLAAARARGAAGGLPATLLSFKPFDAANRRTEAVLEQGGQRFRVLKGAVQALAEVCGLEPAARAALDARAARAAGEGYRVLAVARGLEQGRAEILGLLTLRDPPRPEAAQLVAALRARGVAVKMLTGDALAVAREVATEVGLAGILPVSVLKTPHAPGAAASILVDAGGFAEVYPEDKFTVVRRLQAAGHVTGMTGDGVNDAPALRQAEVGIAVSNATDVARSSASVVLTEPGLGNILELVEQGRAIYQRILTWIINKVSRTVLKAAFVAIAYVATGKFVVSACCCCTSRYSPSSPHASVGASRPPRQGAPWQPRWWPTWCWEPV